MTLQDVIAAGPSTARRSRELLVTLAGSLEATTVADARFSAFLDSPTFSRPVELQCDPIIATLATALLCSDVLVVGRIDANGEHGSFRISVIELRALDVEAPVEPADGASDDERVRG
jgi:hypothetical protein